MEFRVEGAGTRQIESLATWTMDALHRAVWIQPPANRGHGPVVEWRWESEDVVESTEGGTRRRKYARESVSTLVEVERRPGATDAGVFDVRNPWCGYTAVIAVVESGGRVSDG